MSSPSALIDFSVPYGKLKPIRLAFAEPEQELVARTASEVPEVLDAVEALGRQGFWCVGYLRYEAATAFEPTAPVHAADGPLAYFAVHRCPMPFPDVARDVDRVLHWERTIGRQEFDRSIARIHGAIEAGEVYQVNYTGRHAVHYRGDPFDLFCALRRSQPRSNAAFIAAREEQVLSVSPELFFDWDGRVLTCAPMKGTAARGATPEIDERNARELQGSAKERAENVMIVDLVRNDLSRIAEQGSVQVPRLFDCKAWPTVWQMVSEVVAETRPGTTLAQIFRSLFPCGSVTGAPKLRAMHWIRNLEPAPRGVYCGAVGVILPGGAARFNVPIRTVTIRDAHASCGIGSGITWSSAAPSEWSEWSQKASFLDQASRPFQLLQTFRLEAGECRHLEMHLDRLAAAGAYFGFSFDREAVRQKVVEAARDLSTASARVRICMDCRGTANVETSPAPVVPEGTPRVRLARRPVHAPSAFLRHKTTRREHYEQFESAATGAFDALLWNRQGEVTEFTRGSVVLERPCGELVTPPLGSGLLDGVGRALAIAAGQVREEIVRVPELYEARRIWFVNSLRGWIEVHLEGAPESPHMYASEPRRLHRESFLHGSEHPAEEFVLQLFIAQDGSTTRLLEAVAGGSFSVHVLDQRVVHELPKQLLGSLPGNRFLRRLTSLEARGHVLLDSLSYIAIDALPEAMARELQEGVSPIGRVLSHLWTRRTFRVGDTELFDELWSVVGCPDMRASRSSCIDTPQGPCIILAETFRRGALMHSDLPSRPEQVRT